MNDLREIALPVAFAGLAVCMVAILLELRGIREDLKRIETERMTAARIFDNATKPEKGNER